MPVIFENRNVSITNVPTWPYYFRNRGLRRTHNEYIKNATRSPVTCLNNKFSIWEGNIAYLNVDVVISASSSLASNGSYEFRPENVPLQVDSQPSSVFFGETKLTKDVIHTTSSHTMNTFELGLLYQTGLQFMIDRSLTTIAFPCTSILDVTGLEASQAFVVALANVRDFLENEHEKVDRVIFCLNEKEDLGIYEKLVCSYFPVL